MKKFLLSLACVLGLSMAAHADDPFVSISTAPANQGKQIANYTSTWQLVDADNADHTWTVANFNNNNGGWSNIRCGRKNNASTASIATDFQVFAYVEKVVVNMSLSNANKEKLTTLKLQIADNTDFENATEVESTERPTDTVDVEFAIDNPQDGMYYRVVFDCSATDASANGFCWVNSISYYGEAGAAPAVTKPTITLGYDNKVSITNSDESAAIYYTLDGNDPTTSSTRYSAPFAITETTTVKAIAVVGSEQSEVVSATFTPYAEYANFAEVIAANPGKNTVVRVNGPFHVAYQNGSNTYVQDAAGNWMLIYSTNKLTATASNGDILGTAVGKYSPYNSLPEFIPVDTIEKTGTGDAVEPVETALEELSTDDLNVYIKLTGVSIAAGSSTTNFTFTQDGVSVTAYNTFYNSSYYDVVTVPTGDNFTVWGFTSINSGKVQVTPVAFDDSQAVVPCETPKFSLASGTVEKGTTVEITCGTEDALIFYTTDGSDPDSNAEQYTAPIAINESLTLKAIAMKEGFNDSEIATAEYSVLADNATIADFDFTNPLSLSIADAINAVEEGSRVTDGDGKAFSLDGLTATANDVNIAFATVGTSTPIRLYNSKDFIDLRMYAYNVSSTYDATKSNTLTVSCNAEGKVISSIEFTSAATSKLLISADKGTFAVDADDSKVAAWSKKDSEGADIDIRKVIFTATGNSRISTIRVVLDYPTTGVSDIAVDSENAPAEYFNLQGVRVANPTPGLYIVRQGSKVTKQVIR